MLRLSIAPLWAFEKVACATTPCNMVGSKTWMRKSGVVLARGPAKRAERSGLTPSFGSTFCIKAKGEKHTTA
jgi:hypothetical protein